MEVFPNKWLDAVRIRLQRMSHRIYPVAKLGDLIEREGVVIIDYQAMGIDRHRFGPTWAQRSG